MFASSQPLSAELTMMPASRHSSRPSTPPPRQFGSPCGSPMQRSPQRVQPPTLSPNLPTLPTASPATVFGGFVPRAPQRPAPPQPRNPTEGPQAPRPCDFRAPYISPLQSLQRGNELFLLQSNVEGATAAWLLALSAGNHESLEAILTERINLLPAGPQRSLALLQRAWVTQRADTAQDGYLLATREDSRLHTVATHVLLGAARIKGSRQTYDQLRLRIGAHLLPQVRAQRQICLALDANDFVTALALATRLRVDLPHLLVPKCAEFICHRALGGGGFEGWQLVPMLAGATIIRDLLFADANTRKFAYGALSPEANRTVWQQFVGVMYDLEPTMFGAAVDKNGRVVQGASASLHVAGVPWEQAMSLDRFYQTD